MKKIARIRQLLFLIVFISTGLILTFGSCMAESPIKYGFWYPSANPSTYQPDWNILTQVGGDFWTANADGTLTAQNSIDHYDSIKTVVRQHGKKFIIPIGSGDYHTIDNIIANHKEEFANNVLNLLQTYGADGVDIDFESPSSINTVTETSNIVLFEDFMRTLNVTLKTANPDYYISIDVTSAFGSVYRNSNLGQYIDSIFLMGYEYQYWLQGKTGPGSPYDDPTRYDVKDTVETMLRYYSSQKIILGLPFYSYEFQADSNRPGANVTSSDFSVLDMKSAMDKAQQYGRMWDSNSHTPWSRYQSGSKWYQFWYEDGESLALKYDFVKSKNLGGVGFWALGFEQGYPDIWNRMFSAQYYTLNVASGAGSGSYPQGQTIAIKADTPPSGKMFDKWIGDTSYVSDIDSLSTTVLEMPNRAISITAAYRDISSPWYNTAWSYRKAIIINHGKVSNTDQSNFPVLVSTTDVELKTALNGGKVHNPNGYDIIFTNQDGSAKLDYEIENYDAVNGGITMWVKIPTLSYTTDTIIYIYYGNPNITSSQENQTGVWNDGGSDNFKGVWHMNQNPAGVSPQILDSTANHNDGISGGMTSEQSISGKLGNALSFDGTDDYVDMGNATNLDIRTAITMEAWIMNPTGASDRFIISKGGEVYELRIDWANRTAVTVQGNLCARQSGDGNSQSGDSLDIFNWHHLVATYDSANESYSLYLDGQLDGSGVWTGMGQLQSSANNLTLGAYWGGLSNLFKGSIDEVRISDTARSADWIKTEYNNQFDSTTFAVFAGEEEYMNHFNITGDNVQAPGATQNVTLTAVNIFGGVNPSYAGNKVITVNGAHSDGVYVPTFTDKDGNAVDFGSSGTIAFVNGIASTNIVLYRAETVNITITDGTYNTIPSFSVVVALPSSPFTPPTKPNITTIQSAANSGISIDPQSIPSNITQIAISLTPDFKGVSWIDFDRKKFSTINQTTQTLYIKLRTNEGAVSDTIIITPQTSINNTISLIDGDIIQCKSSNDPNAVYIVKIIGTKTYIRHITSIQIFNYYKHLKWDNLKQVDSLTSFSLSSWIRVNTNPNGLPKAEDKVYEINGDQTKHWINMTAQQFLTHGGSDEAIYTVNTGELNLYSAGPDVVSL